LAPIIATIQPRPRGGGRHPRVRLTPIFATIQPGLYISSFSAFPRVSLLFRQHSVVDLRSLTALSSTITCPRGTANFPAPSYARSKGGVFKRGQPLFGVFLGGESPTGIIAPGGVKLVGIGLYPLLKGRGLALMFSLKKGTCPFAGCPAHHFPLAFRCLLNTPHYLWHMRAQESWPFPADR